MAHCKSCGLNIAWVKTPKGRAAPVNPLWRALLPHPGGQTLVLDDDGIAHRGHLLHSHPSRITVIADASITSSRIFDAGRLTVSVAEKKLIVVGRESHFSTCPGAAAHRKTKT